MTTRCWLCGLEVEQPQSDEENTVRVAFVFGLPSQITDAPRGIRLALSALRPPRLRVRVSGVPSPARSTIRAVARSLTSTAAARAGGTARARARMQASPESAWCDHCTGAVEKGLRPWPGQRLLGEQAP